MRKWTDIIAVLGLIGAGASLSVPSAARTAIVDAPAGTQGFSGEAGSGDGEEDALPYLQCVPYARQVSGIQIQGDALTWWDKAAGRYARGNRPAKGAVMSFRPYGRMTLGHVATISRVIDSRTVLLRHANWSPIDGRRGQIEDDVRAVDVSPGNDWSEVRVWYAPLGDLGTTHWPVDGFIYNRPPTASERLTVLASADRPQARAPLAAKASAAPSRIGADFLDGIVPEVKSPERKVARRELAYDDAPLRRTASGDFRNDPIGRIIASRMR